MSEEKERKRPIRERQKDLTRSTILEALGQILIEQGIHGFSVQSVADRAGVSHRTVYRHFPNREALLEGLAEEIDNLSVGLQIPRTLDDFTMGIHNSFKFLEEHREMMTAFLQVSLTSGFRAKSTRARDLATQKIVQELTPALSEREQREGAALIRFLASSVAWLIFTSQLGLTSEEATETVHHALGVIRADLLRRNKKAEKQND